MRTLTIAAFLLAAAPAMALEIPKGGGKDSRVCTVAYDPDNVVGITAAAGDEVTVVFGKEETIGWVSLSDSFHLKYTQDGKDTNAVHFKASAAMPTQPINVRTVKPGSPPSDYPIQWTSIEPPPPSPQRVADASGAVQITEAPPAATPCYIIRYTYADQEKVAKAAQWREAAVKRRQDQAEIALHQATDISRCDVEPTRAPVACNYKYITVGDRSLLPRETPGHPSITDDGYTMLLRFPGNLPIPIILTVRNSPYCDHDDHEAQPTGITIEDGGIVKLHTVDQHIVLRDGDRAACILNKRFDAIGNNPGTGTSSADIDRETRRK